MEEAEDVPVEAGGKLDGRVVEAVDFVELEFSIFGEAGDDAAAACTEVDGDADIGFLGWHGGGGFRFGTYILEWA